ncbi:hypothetical protein CEXT_654231 [Caerostris extrusa]|uniref:Reverse transcriptase/retrotransposon-derived protein RNase H-like domain-containing protein n=1 Tax=Caerostris extrusa TaxID=172846 RepID=A0AAV4XY45_CAEEX|nr:hypothetical protein CEXT_654231 [Caerostris extrusa]
MRTSRWFLAPVYSSKNGKRKLLSDVNNLLCTLPGFKKKMVQQKRSYENSMYRRSKEDLVNAALLTFPNPDLPLALYTDASSFAIDLFYSNMKMEIGNQ